MLETSEKIDQISEALKEFQSEVVSVERNVTNPFFRAKYADLSSIMKESQPILTKHELAISQFPDNLDGKQALTTILMHTSGQFIKATIPLPVSEITTVVKKEKTTVGQKTEPEKIITTVGYDPQESGRALTYMRRYGYAAVIQLVIDEDDDGNRSYSQKKERIPPPEPSNPETVQKIRDIWKENGGTEEQLTNWVKKNAEGKPLEEVSGTRQAELLATLEARKAEKAKAVAETPTEPIPEENETPSAVTET